MNEQTLRTFQTDSRRTAPKDLSEREQLINWAMGLAGEAGEISAYTTERFTSFSDGIRLDHNYVGSHEDCIINESGDVLWYLARFCDTLSIDIDTLYLEAKKNRDKFRRSTETTVLRLTAAAGEVVDYVKKISFQHHSLDRDKLRTQLSKTLTHVLELIEDECRDADIFLVAQKNTQKLLRRYPNGFTVEASVNRES